MFNRLDTHPSGVGHALPEHPGRTVQLRRAEHLRHERHRHSTRTSRPTTLRRVTLAVIGTRAVLSANGFVRHDHLTYSPVRTRLMTRPATVSQDRTLTNSGFKADLSYLVGQHNIKVGGDRQRDQARTRTSRWASPTRPIRRSPATMATSIPRSRRSISRNGGAPLRVRSVVHRSNSRRSTFRTRSRPGRRRSSSACVLTTTTDWSAARRLQPRLGVAYCRAEQRDGRACVVRPHDGDAVQREPAALERASALNGAARRRARPGPSRRAQRGASSASSRRSALDRRRRRLLQQAHEQWL